MPRKLNWNKSLTIDKDSGVTNVVRNFLNNKVEMENLDYQQSQLLEQVNKLNPSINSLTNIVIDQSANIVNNSLVDSVINSPDNTSSDYVTNIIDNQIDNLLTNSQSNQLTDLSSINTFDTLTNPPSIESINKLPSSLEDPSNSQGSKSKIIVSLTAMGEWHSESEQKVYEAMYEETIAHRRKERYFMAQSLCEKTGIGSQTTVRTAIQGLIDKLSIEIISRKGGGRLAVRYRVYSPSEIIARRRKVQLKIDPQSKKILS